MTRHARVDRERIGRTLTFWLRPAFVLRTLNRFQKVAGFDRAIALSSSTFTALIPLAVIVGGALPHTDASEAAHKIIVRYGLTGAAAKAVEDLFAPVSGADTGVSVLGGFLLLVAILSFSRGMQRLFEQTWELKPLSVRNTLNDLIWIVGLVCYILFSWWVRRLLDGGRVQLIANLVLVPVSAIFLAWSGRVLSDRRIEWKGLVSFAILGAALVAVYLIGAGVYVPHLFSSYASRYGVIGAVLAMISALFALMLVLVGSAAVGREVSEELDRIGRGERPPDDEVRREWDAVNDEARSRWGTLRERIDHIRRHHEHRP